MTKKTVLGIIIGIAVCVAISVLVNFIAGSKIVYVDNSKVINNYKGSIETVAKLKDKKDQYERELIEKKNQIDNYRAQLLKKSDLSTKEINEAQKLITEKEKELIEKENYYNKILKEEEASLLTPLLKEINDKIREYGKKKGYHIVLGATENGNIVYGDKRYDITEAVLKYINKADNKIEDKSKK